MEKRGGKGGLKDEADREINRVGIDKPMNCSGP